MKRKRDERGGEWFSTLMSDLDTDIQLYIEARVEEKVEEAKKRRTQADNEWNKVFAEYGAEDYFPPALKEKKFEQMKVVFKRRWAERQREKSWRRCVECCDKDEATTRGCHIIYGVVKILCHFTVKTHRRPDMLVDRIMEFLLTTKI